MGRQSDAMEVFLQLLEATLGALLAIKCNEDRTWDQENISRSGGLYHNIAWIEFLLGLHAAISCLEYTKGPTIGLQKSSADLLSAYGFVNSSSTLKEEAQKKTHQRIFSSAERMANDLAIPGEKPRICGRQQHRATVTIPFLDHPTVEMERPRSRVTCN